MPVMKPFKTLLWLGLLASPATLRAGTEIEPLRFLAIQDGGRTKPLDTFAREAARRLTGARAFGAESVNGLDPIEWLLSLHTDPAALGGRRLHPCDARGPAPSGRASQ